MNRLIRETIWFSHVLGGVLVLATITTLAVVIG